jgi:hypothetical protein
MFEKLGIANAMKDKARKIPATTVGEIVAKGEAEIGFQQDQGAASTEARSLSRWERVGVRGNGLSCSESPPPICCANRPLPIGERWHRTL